MTVRRSTESDHTDAHLVEAARRGDRRSRERVVTGGLPTVRAIAARYGEFGLPLDDLVQEGTVGLLEAIDHYEVGPTTDFDAYARFRIRRAMRRALTSQSRLSRLAVAAGSILESIVGGGATPDPETAAVAEEAVRTIDHAVDTLPDRQRAVVTRHFGFGCEPQDIAEVAASLHVSQQRARAIERDAFYALRDELEPFASPPHPGRR